MSDNLVIGGATFTGVTGIKATDTNDNVVTFESGGITVDDIAQNLQPSGAITLQATVKELPDYVFYGKPITDIVAPGITNANKIGRRSINNTQISTITDRNFPSLTGGRVTFGTDNKFIKTVKLTATIDLDDGSGPFRYASNLETLEFPHATAKGTGNYFTGNAPKLWLADLGNCSSIGGNSFNGDTSLRVLILRRTGSIATLTSVSAFASTPFRNNTTGTVYVPSALIETYKTATNWSTLYNNGTCLFAAIEGSEYEL